MIVKFENIYISVHHEKYVLINLLRMYWYCNFYPLKIWFGAFSICLFRNVHHEEECKFFEIFFFFLINIAFFTLYFFYARVWKLDFFKINETAKCVFYGGWKFRSLLPEIKREILEIQFYTNNYSRGEKIHVM